MGVWDYAVSERACVVKFELTYDEVLGCVGLAPINVERSGVILALDNVPP